MILPLSPGACLREAASAKAGERAGVRGKHIHPHPCLPAGRLTLPHPPVPPYQ
jgi:hypothetical protein